MAGLFSLLHFGNAWALWSALAAPILVLAYLRKRSQKKRLVSSTLILKTLSKRKTIHRRIKPPFRFFVELIALLLLAIAAAVPVLMDKGERVALVMDSSLSMRAAATGGSRMDEGVRAAKDWLNDQSSTKTVRVFTSAPRLVSLYDEPTSPADAARTLTTVVPSYASDSLDASINELAQSGDYDLVYVVSDKTPEFISENPAGVAEAANRRTRVEVHTVGSPKANVYLSNLVLSRTGMQGNEGKVTASVGLSGGTAQEVEVRLFSKGLQTGANRTLIRSQRLNVVPETFVETTFDLPESEGDKVYQVELAGGTNLENAIKEDDVAWVSERSSGDAGALLITAAQSDTALGLSAIPGLSVYGISPEAFGHLSAAELDRYGLLIFHQSAPASIPDIPSLLILPPERNPLFPVSGEALRPKITSWASDHPLTLYLRVPLLAPEGAVTFTLPPWAQSIVNVEPGSLIAAGERQGKRYAAVGMELLPFEGAKTAAPSVLTLNLINWLTGGSQLSGTMLAGSPLRLDERKAWTIITPAGKAVRLGKGAEEARSYSVDEPGMYLISGAGKDGRESQVLTVNTFYPQESAVYSKNMLFIPESVAHDAESQDLGTPLWRYGIMAALAFLLLECLLHLTLKERFA